MTLLAEIEAFLAETGMPDARFGKRSVDNAVLVRRLRNGSDVMPKTAARVRQYIAAERANPTPIDRPKAKDYRCACGAKISHKALRCRKCASRAQSRNTRRPVPHDFHEVAPGVAINVLQRHYGAGQETIARWRDEAGIPKQRPIMPSTRRLVPDGFADVVRQLTVKQLRERYAASEPLIRRWCAETGTEPRKAGVVRFRQVQPRPLTDHRDQSRAGMAAIFLQRFGPVFRCNANGHADPKGTHWRRSSAILTDVEIMERATRNGWAPDAWKAIAA